MNILLCTLGASWAVIPEVVGFVAPELLDLYAHHPHREPIRALREKHGIATFDELWVCTSEGEQTRRSLDHLHAWWALLGAPRPLRVWTAAGTDQLASQLECDHIRELTLRVALRAAEASSGGQLVLSLAGGRKTMSADLQWAGTLFGARAWLHVVGPDPLPEAIARGASPKTFARPLARELAAAITPLVVGSASRDDLLDVALDGATVSAERFPLPAAELECSWAMDGRLDSGVRRNDGSPTGATLTADIQRRQREGSRLFGNFIAQLAADESHENWRSLYRLPPARIEDLRKKRLAASDRDWLVALPKADLHRHLGGSLSLAGQRRVGAAVWAALSPAQRDSAQQAVAPLLTQETWPWDWPVHMQNFAANATFPHARAASTAALLVHASERQLQHNLYEVTEPRVALKERRPHGFAAYERPGELSGSAILGHPAALAPYAAELVAQAHEEGLAYVELRGSPHKYRPEAPAAFVRELAAALASAGGEIGGDTGSPAPPWIPASAGMTAPGDASSASRLPLPRRTPGSMPAPGAPIFRFVWILDRRQPERLAAIVEQAVAALREARAASAFLVGLDLAGDEANPIGDPEKLAPAFTPAFRACLPITIHAGEGEAADNIWQAAYHLHADRIGHGLSLADHENLAARFRNRGIALELCPTSNREVVGFHDSDVPASAGRPRYPLRRFLELGLPLAICTDNPGISRTTLADEFLAAARMGGGLSHWEALALIKQGFAHAFLPADEREALLKRVDRQIFDRFAESPR